jgi:hypothetical protein
LKDVNMPCRSGVDAQQGSRRIVEFKTVPRAGSSLTSFWLGGLVRSRIRWFHFLPLAGLLIAGAWVPGFLTTLALLLVSVLAALGVFILVIQLPLAYLARVWRELRRGGSGRTRQPRGARSSGTWD